MNDPIRLAAIIGSLRHESHNRSVFDAAVELAPDGVGLTELGLRDVPLYDGDLEAQGDPASVTLLKQGVIEADGLVVFTPEYNRSVPAVTKNAIDWLSRRPGDSALAGASVGIVAATPGRHEAAGVRGHLETSVAANTDRLFDPSIGLGSIGRQLEDGRLVDEDARRRLADWLADFVRFVRKEIANAS